MGHLGTDPEVRFTSSGQKVTTLRVATNQKRGGKEETLWWRVTVWGEQCDKIMSYLKKGSSVVVNGDMLKPEIYTNREDQPQISLNVVAYNISFSPFGRKEGSNQVGQGYESISEHGKEQKKDQEQKEDQEQLQESDMFEADEIPF